MIDWGEVAELADLCERLAQTKPEGASDRAFQFRRGYFTALLGILDAMGEAEQGKELEAILSFIRDVVRGEGKNVEEDVHEAAGTG
ncbi:MAG: hypothetical protein QN198_01215 [Armatimonadota bacterium]|nr:hypothetical protein [Armatimonadota bacterium]MDR5702203.1 hypothetical protein [Armatimonadota bacterium]MDR7435900.1 hypothetical protein [Armatimonadota bacterium]